MPWSFEDKFNSDTKTVADLNGQDSWSGDAASNYVINTGGVPYEGNQCVRNNQVENTGIGYAGIGCAAGTMYIAIRIDANSDQDTAVCGFQLRDDADNQLTSVYFRRGGATSYDLRYYWDINNTVLVTPAVLTTWYIIAIEYNTNSDVTFRLKWMAAGGSWSAWTDWRAPKSGSFDGTIDEIWLKNEGTSAGFDFLFDTITPTDPTVVTSYIKTINGLAKASVKTVDDLVNASVKTFDGLT